MERKPPNTGCSGPGCARGYEPGLQEIVVLREGISPVRPAAEPIRWALGNYMKRNKKRLFANDPDIRQRARRELVVILSALTFFFLGLYLTVILITKFFIWFPMEMPQPGIVQLFAIFLFLVVFLFLSLIFLIIISIPWYFIMSFYLTVEEWQELSRIPTPNAPFITCVFTSISTAMMAWKTRRESNKSRNNT